MTWNKVFRQTFQESSNWGAFIAIPVWPNNSLGHIIRISLGQLPAIAPPRELPGSGGSHRKIPIFPG